MRFHGTEAARPTRLGMAAALFAGLLVQLFVGGVASAQLASTPWPMAHGNAQHTGRSAYVGPSNPSVNWMVEFPFLRSSPIIGTDGTVYVGVAQKFFAFDPADGSELWYSELPSTIKRNAGALDVNGQIYIGARDNRLWALDADDGQQLWSYQIHNDGDVNTSAAIAPDGTVYMAGSWNGLLHALTPENGTLLWSLRSGGDVGSSSPTLGLDGTVYVASMRGHIRAVTAGGVFKWQTVVGRVRFGTAAVGADGTIYVGSYDGLNAVAPDGTLLWTFVTEGRVASTPALGADGTIYVGSLGAPGSRLGTFYAVDPDGNEVWRYQPEGTGNGFRGSPVIDSNGDIYVPSGNRLISLDQDGALRWEFFTSSRRSIVSTPAIGADGSLYLAADEFYALRD